MDRLRRASTPLRTTIGVAQRGDFPTITRRDRTAWRPRRRIQLAAPAVDKDSQVRIAAHDAADIAALLEVRIGDRCRPRAGLAWVPWRSSDSPLFHLIMRQSKYHADKV
jgi:hypothetical protein